MHSCLNAVTPIMHRDMRLKIERSSNIQDVLMFFLNNKILLRGFYTTMLIYDAFGSIKIRHGKLLAIITSDVLNESMELSLNHSNKRNKERSSFRF